jgi:hypothetical protein
VYLDSGAALGELEKQSKISYSRDMKKTAGAWFLWGILGFLSCSNGVPKIDYGFIDLVYYQSEKGPEERFSFFILPEDDEGIENLSELYLYHDREGLRWSLQEEDWIQYEEDKKIWIGSRAIANINDRPLPRGKYRAVLINKGGEKSERIFTFDGPEEPRYPFPIFLVSEGSFTIESKYPEHHFICYDREGNFVQDLPLSGTSGNIAGLGLSGAVMAVCLWARDEEHHTSAFSEPVSIR